MTEMTKYTAEHLLGLTGSYDKQDFNRAYRAKVKEYHPDLAASRGEDPIAAEELMTQVNAAREYLAPLFDYNDVITCSTIDSGSGNDVGAKSSYTETQEEVHTETREEVHAKNVDPAMGYNPDGTWNINPPWRYETNGGWEGYDPIYGKEGPYGGWGMNHPWGKAYFQGCQKEAWVAAEQAERAERVREYDRKMNEERSKPKIDPVEQFRWHDGPMPDYMKERYEKINKFHYRLIFTLICFLFCLSYVICDLAALPIRDDEIYMCAAYGIFFIAAINVFTGWVTNPIRDARLRRLDRKLAAWRAANGT